MKNKAIIITLSLFIVGCWFYITSNSTGHRLNYLTAETMHTGKQCHAALMSFAQENDCKFPSGTDFQQLLNTGHIDDKKYFDIQTSHFSDNDGSEKNWAYISGLTLTAKSGTPILSIPMIALGKFDPKPFNNSAIIARLDGSVSRHPILPDGTIRFTKADGTEYNPFLPENLPPNTRILVSETP